MNRSSITKRASLLVVLAAIYLAPVALFAQTAIQMPKNKYKVEQDVKLGNDAAAQVEKQYPILNDAEATRMVARVGQRLVAAIPPQYQQPAFNYRFKVVNAGDINAFALPGGPMYVNRGMIEAARNEGEMAGVMAHEISHVALRHATAQQTKQGSFGNQLGVIGLILGGAVLGGDAGAQLGALGAAAWMTKFSREYETQADTLGAQIMARAGYDPRDLANMFKTIEAQNQGGNVPQWLSSHPSPANRYENISREASMLRIAEVRGANPAEFNRVQNRFKSMPKARTMAEIEKGASAGQTTSPTANGAYTSSVAVPSVRTRQYSGAVSVSVPNNWKEFPGSDSVQFAPEGAYGKDGITHGAMLGSSPNTTNNLSQDTQTLVDSLLKGNTYLSKRNGYTQTYVGGKRGYTITLGGTSPITGRGETVTIYTTSDSNGSIIYLATVSPDAESYRYTSTFRTMVSSLRVN